MRRLRSAIRARLTLARIAVAIALVAAFLGADTLLEQDEAGAPADHAVRLVPAEVLAYVHLSVDRDSEQWRNATRLVKRLPALVSLRNRVLRGLTPRGGRIDLEREVYPWLDNEAALALLADRRGTARSLILLEVSDRDLARSFLSRAVGRVRKSTYRGTPIRAYGNLATAFLGDFLAIGRPDNVRAAIDTLRSRVGSLAGSPSFARARAALPDRDRLLYAYATRNGIKRVLRTRPDILGRVVRLADDPDLVAATAALRAEEDRMRVDYAAALSRASSRRAHRRRERRRFVPRLLETIPGDAIAYLGMRGADRIFESIEETLGAAALQLPPSLSSLRAELSGEGGSRLRGALRPLLGKEAALFVSRSDSRPLVTLIVNDIDGGQGGRLLERLQPLLARLLERPAVGQVPTFRPTRVAGLDAATLTITPALELTYAVFGGRAVVSTSPAGIRAVKSARSRITENPLFEREIRDDDFRDDDFDRVTAVLFLDLEQLLALGEQAGLGGSPSYRAFRAGLSQVSAVSAITSSTAAEKTAAIFIEVP
jgi:hypothetical protein